MPLTDCSTRLCHPDSFMLSQPEIKKGLLYLQYKAALVTIRQAE